MAKQEKKVFLSYIKKCEEKKKKYMLEIKYFLTCIREYVTLGRRTGSDICKQAAIWRTGISGVTASHGARYQI